MRIKRTAQSHPHVETVHRDCRAPDRTRGRGTPTGPTGTNPKGKSGPRMRNENWKKDQSGESKAAGGPQPDPRERSVAQHASCC